jgi:hypothetical protein
MRSTNTIAPRSKALTDPNGHDAYSPADVKSTRKPPLRFVLSIGFGLLALLAVVGLVWLALKFGFGAGGLVVALVWAASASGALYLAYVGRVWPAVVIALLLRLGMAWSLTWALSVAPDPKNYLMLATAWAHGGTYQVSLGGIGWWALYPPMYPFLLSILLRFPVNIFVAAAAFNLALQLAAAFAVYRTAVCLNFKRAGLAAVALLIWPFFIISWTIVGKESLGLLCLCLSLWMLARWYNTGRISGALYGINAGVAALTQPAFLPVIVLWCLLVRRPKIRTIALAALFGALTLLPWWIWTVKNTGGLIPLTSAAGISAYWAVAGPYHYPASGVPASEYLRNAVLLKEALRLVASDPAAFLYARTETFLLGMGLEHSYFFVLDQMAWPIRIEPRAVLLVGQTSLILGWIAAAISSWKITNPFLSRIAISAVITSTLIQSWFEFGARQRLYFAPIVVLFFVSLMSARTTFEIQPDDRTGA